MYVVQFVIGSKICIIVVPEGTVAVKEQLPPYKLDTGTFV